jgi:dienelactone hydrolase
MRHTLRTTLCASAFSPPAFRSETARKRMNYMALNTQTIEYRDGETLLTGQLVWKDLGARASEEGGAGKRTGILVVHGGAGLDDHAKDRAVRFADLGFVVFACDMYGNGIAGNRERIMARIAELRSDPSILCRRAQVGIDVLAARPGIDGRIAAVGYCFGGMTVLELARSGADLLGVVSVHGTLDTKQRSEIDSIRAKILVCHGALDPHVPMSQVTAFIDEMNQAHADFQLNVYGGAQHGFTHEKSMNVPGVGYHAQSDARSSVAIEDFLNEVFGDNQSAAQSPARRAP